MKIHVIWIMYFIIIITCAWLGKRTVKESFEVNQLLINPLFIPGDRNQSTCNVFDCNFRSPPRPPSPPKPEPVKPKPIVQPAPVCPAEITLEDIRNYDLYTPEEQLIEERIAEKQQQLNELEEKSRLVEAAFNEQNQVMEESMRMRQDSIRDMELADAQRKNTSDPTQTIMSDISRKLLRIESKLGIMPI